MVADCGEHRGAALVRLGIARIQAYSLVQVGQRTFELALPDQRPAAKEIGLRLVRVDAYGRAVFLDRAIEFAASARSSPPRLT